MQTAVNRVFRDYARSDSPRMPAWGDVKADLIREVLPVMYRVQLEAIRAMFARYGDGPAPPEAKPLALERATAFANDLASVSIRRWKALGKKATAAEKADWYKQNFGRDRAKVIAITETTFAHQQGEEIALRYLRKKRKKKLVGIWRAEPGRCKFCAKMDGKPEKYWRRYYPKGPPSPHPHCQCHIEYELMDDE